LYFAVYIGDQNSAAAHRIGESHDYLFRGLNERVYVQFKICYRSSITEGIDAHIYTHMYTH